MRRLALLVAIGGLACSRDNSGLEPYDGGSVSQDGQGGSDSNPREVTADVGLDGGSARDGGSDAAGGGEGGADSANESVGLDVGLDTVGDASLEAGGEPAAESGVEGGADLPVADLPGEGFGADAACPLPVANAGPDQTLLHRSTTVALDGSRSGPDPLTYAWSIVDAQGLSFSPTVGSSPGWSTTITGAAPVNCASGKTPKFRLAVTNACGTSTDDVVVTVTNDAPSVRFPQYIEGPPGTFTVTVPPGYKPSFTAVGSDPDGGDTAALTYQWTDLNAVPVSTTASRITNTLVFSSNTVGGTSYSFDVQVSDCDLTAKAHLVVVTASCVYARAGATCSGPCTGTLAAPYPSIAAAIAASSGAPVCVTEGTYAETPTMKNGVDVYGGFNSSTGLPWSTSRNTRSVIVVQSAAGVSFGPDVTATLQYFQIQQSSAISAASAQVVLFSGSSGRLRDSLVIATRGTTVAAVKVVTGASTAATTPLIANCTISGASSSSPTNAFGVWGLDTGSGNPVDVTILGSSISAGQNAGSPSQLATGVRFEGQHITGSILQSNVTGAAAGAAAGTIGVDLIQTNGVTIRANESVSGGASATASYSYGIRLDKTANTSIQYNISVQAGSGAYGRAGIIDGNYSRFSGFTSGDSSGLVVARNGVVSGSMPGAAAATSVDLAAAVALVGSGTPSIVDNVGVGSQLTGGLAGGATKNSLTGAEPVTPTCSGLYLWKTKGALVRNNTIRSGGAPCGEAFPAVAATDGDPQLGGSGSDGTVWDRNVMLVQVPAVAAGTVGAINQGTGLALHGSTAAVVTSNIIATASATTARGLYALGAEASVDSNLIHVDWDPFGLATVPSAGSLRKWAIDVAGASTGALALRNNIVFVRVDAPADNTGERLAVRETVTSGGGPTSEVTAFEGNLLFIEGDDPLSTGTPAYYRIRAGVTTLDLAQKDLNAVPGIKAAANSANLVADPLLTALGSNPSRPFSLRLRGRSPAVDAALTASSNPTTDIDNETRPKGLAADRGADEF